MAKANVTRKWIKENFICISVGYCELPHLLWYQNASYYTCGVYGWNFDAYTFGNYAITTGYRNMINDISKNYNSLIYEYDSKARQIINNQEYKGNKRDDVNYLLKEFLTKVFDIPSDRLFIF